MSTTAWVGLGAGVLALLVIIYLASGMLQPRPAVQVSTDNADVSIGAGGVSVSVAPSSGP